MAEAFKSAAWAKNVCELLPKGSGLGCRLPGSQVKWITPKKFFGPSGSLWSKLREGGRAPRVPPLHPPLKPSLLLLILTVAFLVGTNPFFCLYPVTVPRTVDIFVCGRAVTLTVLFTIGTTGTKVWPPAPSGTIRTCYIKNHQTIKPKKS